MAGSNHVHYTSLGHTNDDPRNRSKVTVHLIDGKYWTACVRMASTNELYAANGKSLGKSLKHLKSKLRKELKMTNADLHLIPVNNIM